MSSFFFFFSSRRRHTRLQGDWSSDVCSSDLETTTLLLDERATRLKRRMLACFATQRESLAVSQIGRASCRERVWISAGAGAGKKKKEQGEGACRGASETTIAGQSAQLVTVCG